MKSIAILRGGLGNQLFQLFGVFILSQKERGSISLDARTYEHPSQSRLGRSFELAALAGVLGIKVMEKPNSKFRIRIALAIQTALRMLSGGPFFRVLSRCGFFVRDGNDLANEDLHAIKKHWYFDSFFFGLPHLKENQDLFETFLEHVLDNFEEVDEVASKRGAAHKSVALHLRLGDFKNVGTDRMIDPRRVSELVRAIGSPSVTLYSDEPELAEKLVRPFHGGEIKLPDANMGPLPTLAEISNSEVLVCSPSTFSWWAGALCSHRGGTVYWPKEFNDSLGIRKLEGWVDY